MKVSTANYTTFIHTTLMPIANRDVAHPRITAEDGSCCASVPSAYVSKCCRALASAAKQVAAVDHGQNRVIAQPPQPARTKTVQAFFTKLGRLSSCTFFKLCLAASTYYVATRVRAPAAASNFVADKFSGKDTPSTKQWVAPERRFRTTD